MWWQEFRNWPTCHKHTATIAHISFTLPKCEMTGFQIVRVTWPQRLAKRKQIWQEKERQNRLLFNIQLWASKKMRCHPCLRTALFRIKISFFEMRKTYSLLIVINYHLLFWITIHHYRKIFLATVVDFWDYQITSTSIMSLQRKINLYPFFQ